MILAWLFSVAISVVIVILISDNGDSENTSQAKKEAMAKIEDPQFFGNPARGDVLPYQRLLREAHQAYAARTSRPNGGTTSRCSTFCTRRRLAGPRGRPRQIAWKKGLPAAATTTGNWNRLILKVLAD